MDEQKLRKVPPGKYLGRFLRCESRWYCVMTGRVECDKCGCYLRRVFRRKKRS